ncbi:MCE family protein [Mycobacterium syngnathidarum]
MPRRIRLLLICLLSTIAIAGTGVILRSTVCPTLTITAQFTSATGLYAGDDVRVAGVKIGRIESIVAHPNYAEASLRVDYGVNIPADAKAVIVAPNLVAARYIQLAPLYAKGHPRLTDGAVIGLDRTAVPIEWDEVKEQLFRLSKELGPSSTVSESSVGRIIESTANALGGNGDKLRGTIHQVSQLAALLADGSGDIVVTIGNLHRFVAALRDSGDELVLFQERLATVSTVLSDSRSDLDAAMKEVAIAVAEVRRFVAGARDGTSDQVQRLANVTQVLADRHADLENLLHIAPTAFANGYNIYNPNMPGAVGSFLVQNFANPASLICTAIGAVENVTSAETSKLCQQYLGPALNTATMNELPLPLNPLLAPVITPDKVVYADPAMATGDADETPTAPEMPPTISAYGGTPGDGQGPPGFAPPQPPAVPGTSGPHDLQGMLLPAEATPPVAPTLLPTPPEGMPSP